MSDEQKLDRYLAQYLEELALIPNSVEWTTTMNDPGFAVGQGICAGFDSLYTNGYDPNESFFQIASALTTGGITPLEVGSIMAASVSILCPQYSGEIVSWLESQATN